MFRFFLLFITLSLALLPSNGMASPPIPSDIKSTVAFVYVKSDKGEMVPIGTGFFIGVKNPKDENETAVYFITAKHVLQNQGKWISIFFLRLNKNDGTSEFGSIQAKTDGINKTVFVHQDDAVDIAVVPMAPDANKYDYKFIPESMILQKKQFQELEIGEGSDVFFTGLFVPYAGYQKNCPIVRFGRVALITDEKIEWNKKLLDLYLIEVTSFGGNSGSPVFFYLGADRKPGVLNLGSPIVKLAGIMEGYFNEPRPLEIIQNANIPIYKNNVGIAAVIPAFKLHELLFSEEMTAQRNSIFKK